LDYPARKLLIFWSTKIQTFLPYPDCAKTAQCLDRQRLCKQRIEAYQILRTLLGLSNGWKNHPTIKMWKGHLGALHLYAKSICIEWRNRGYKDTMLRRIVALGRRYATSGWYTKGMPPWWGNRRFHASHKAALLAKNHEWYSQFGWKVQPKIDYVWPTA
jgi:hypothetical protein